MSNIALGALSTSTSLLELVLKTESISETRKLMIETQIELNKAVLGNFIRPPTVFDQKTLDAFFKELHKKD
jgi:hypothetical protein